MEAQLARYLSSRIEGAPDVRVSKLFRVPGGASRETWIFEAALNAAGRSETRSFVVRRDPPASLVESDREVEYAFYQAFQGHPDVPVPRMRWLESDPVHLGAPFFVMDRIGGCDSNMRRLLEPDFTQARPRLARRMYAILAAIHAFDWRSSGITRVAVAPGAEDSWRRELDHWEDTIDRNELSPQPIARAAIRWLRAHPPPPARRIAVVHGDYRVGNFLYTKEGIEGVLDWEMAHLGDPLEDLAWSFMEAWEWARDGLKGGIASLDDAIRFYEAASGTRIDREALHWWDVFSGVKAQGLWLTGARSFQEGRTDELILAYTAWVLTNYQDEILLRAMGRGA